MVQNLNRLRKAVLLCVGLQFCLIAITRGAITELNYWRMGENDPLDTPPTTALSTVDSVGGQTLVLFSNPLYWMVTNSTAIAHTRSDACVRFADGAFALMPVVALTNNFGIECWVSPNTIFVGQALAYNGDTGTNGWGLFLTNGAYMALFGGVGFFGAGAASPGIWAHLALVVSDGMATFYVNGVSSGTTTSAVIPPTGHFGLACDPDNSQTNQFVGLIDEVRLFTFSPGAFSTNDLLINAGAPIAATMSATSVESSSASLNGSVNPNGLDTQYYFQYGTTTNYGNNTSATGLPAAKSALAVSSAVSGLLADTSYYFQLVASNSVSNVIGASFSFNTPVAAPSVTTTPASPITFSNATLNGLVSPNGLATAWYFRYGATTNYGSFTTTNSLPATNLSYPVSAVISGLTMNSVRHFCVVASNADGVVTGADQGLINYSLTVTANPQTLGWLASAPPTNQLTANGVLFGPTNFFVTVPPTNGQLVEFPGFATNGLWQYRTSVNSLIVTDSFAFYAGDSLGDDSAVSIITFTVTNLPYAFSQTIGWNQADYIAGSVGGQLSGLVSSGPTEFSIVAYPTNGQLLLVPGFTTLGAWVYKPFVTNPIQSDSFLFRVMDTNGNVSLPAMVSMPATNLPYAYSQSVAWREGTTPTNTLQGIVLSGVTNFVVLQGPTNGTLTQLSGFLTNGQWEYQPTNAPSDSGPDSFTFKVTDNASHSSAPATVSIFVTNSLYAINQSVIWARGTFPTNQLTGTVPSGPTNFAIVQPPLYGQITTLSGFATNGMWKYQPYATNFFGTDSFTFAVHGATTNLSAPGTISITVTNVPAAPYAHFQYLKTRPGQALAILLSGDDDGNDPVFPTNATFYAHTRDMFDWNPVFTILSYPTNGTLTGEPPNLVYSPLASNVFDSLSFKVNNGAMDSAPATILIKVAPYNSGTNYFDTNFGTNYPANSWQPADVPAVNPGTVRPGFEGWAFSATNGTVQTDYAGTPVSTSDRTDDGDVVVTNLPDRLKRSRIFSLGGSVFPQLIINNNGLISFEAAVQQWVSHAFPAGPDYGPLIAPLWQDVDTRGGPPGGDVTYGAGYVADFFGVGPPSYGRPALIVTWNDVGSYQEQTSPLNRYQAVLIDRSDLHVGDWDLELNYEHIHWFYGMASSNEYPGAGFDFGDGVHYYNMPGNLTSNVAEYVTNSDTVPPTPGRYIFRFSLDTNAAQITSLTVAAVGPTNAVLTALVNPANTRSAVSFVISNAALQTTTNVFAASIPTGVNAFVPVTLALGNLISGSTYTAMVMVSNGLGVLIPTNSVSFATLPRLSDISFSSGTLSPTFDPSVSGYVCDVSNAPFVTVTSLAETPTTALLEYQIIAGESGYEYAGDPMTLPLNFGENPLRIQVYSSYGQMNSYTVNVIRTPSSDSSLAGLTVSQGTIAPGFTPATLNYSDAVSNAVTNLTLTAWPNSPYAAIQINGGATVTNTNTAAISLGLGTNTISILVTAQDGVTTSSYMLNAVRLTGPPIVTNLSATSITSSNAILNAGVNPQGTNASVYFEYGTTTNYGSMTATAPLVGAVVSEPVSLAANNLLAGATCHYAAVATSFFGTTTSADQAFTVPAGLPIVTTVGASNITASNVVLFGTVNPNGAAAGWYFNYGLTTNFGAASATNLLVLSNSPIAVSNLITNLSPGTAYYFQLAATNSAGTNVGTNLTFITLDVPRTLSNLSFISPGQLMMQFTGGPNVNYTVLTATNINLPLSNWISLGAPTVLSNNIYQFIDPRATNARQYYMLK